MKEKEFLNNYFSNLKDLISFKEEEISKLQATKKILVDTHNNNKKTLIFGNGGSAAIASHFSVDLTKKCKN